MRIRLAKIGAVAPDDGRGIKELLVVDEVYPVLHRPEDAEPYSDPQVVGQVVAVTEELDGWVTGALVTYGDFDPKGLAAEIDCDSMRGPVEAMVCRLRAVTLGKRPMWPDMWIGEEK